MILVVIWQYVLLSISYTLYSQHHALPCAQGATSSRGWALFMSCSRAYADVGH